MGRKRNITKGYRCYYENLADNPALSYSIVCEWLNSKNSSREIPFENIVLANAKNHSIKVGDWLTAEKIIQFLLESKAEDEISQRTRKATMPYAVSALINENLVSEILNISFKNKN